MTTTTTTIRLAGVEVPRIGLGTNRLDHSDDGIAFVREAAEAGIRHIDTAHSYTGGDSEKAIGDALGDRADFVIATKGGSRGQGHPDLLREQIEQSLRSLQTDTIDLYYLHRPPEDATLEESLGAIKEYVDRGAIRAVGISEFDVDQIERARRVVEVAAVQNHYNLEERKHEPVIDHCEREGIVFVPFFPLRGGDDVAAAIAGRHGATPNTVKLAWLLQRSPVMAPIPGTRSVEHLRENLSALELELGEDELAELRSSRRGAGR